MKYITHTFISVFILLISIQVYGQIDLTYQEPPKEIMDLADVAPPPTVILDDNANWMVMLHRSAFKSIEEVSAREYRLAGLRINPKINGSSRSRYYRDISVLNMKTSEEKSISGLPEKAFISNFSWARIMKNLHSPIMQKMDWSYG